MSAIYKNGIAYGGAASAANLIQATDINGDASNVQAELNKKLENNNIVNNGLTVEEGYVLDARYGKKLTDDINNLIDGKIFTNYDPSDDTFSILSSSKFRKVDNGYFYVNASDTMATFAALLQYDKTAALSASEIQIVKFSDDFITNVIGRTYFYSTAFVEYANGSTALKEYQNKMLAVLIDTWNSSAKSLAVKIPTALTTSDSLMIRIFIVFPITK